MEKGPSSQSPKLKKMAPFVSLSLLILYIFSDDVVIFHSILHSQFVFLSLAKWEILRIWRGWVENSTAPFGNYSLSLLSPTDFLAFLLIWFTRVWLLRKQRKIKQVKICLVLRFLPCSDKMGGVLFLSRVQKNEKISCFLDFVMFLTFSEQRNRTGNFPEAFPMFLTSLLLYLSFFLKKKKKKF